MTKVYNSTISVTDLHFPPNFSPIVGPIEKLPRFSSDDPLLSRVSSVAPASKQPHMKHGRLHYNISHTTIEHKQSITYYF